MNKNYTLSFCYLIQCVYLIYLFVFLCTSQNKIINQNIVIIFRCYFNFSASSHQKRKEETRKYNRVLCCALVGGSHDGMKLYIIPNVDLQ